MMSESKSEGDEFIKCLEKSGLIGCFDGTGVNSENYKSLFSEEDFKRTEALLEKARKNRARYHKHLEEVKNLREENKELLERLEMSEWKDAKENPPPKGPKLIVLRYNNLINFVDVIAWYNYSNELVDSNNNPLSENFVYWMPWEPPKIPKKKHLCKISFDNGYIKQKCYEIDGKLYFYYLKSVVEVNFCPICGYSLKK